MTMTNAEWCIKNNIQFKDVGTMPFLNPMHESQFVSIGYFDVGGIYHECYKGEKLGDSTADDILSWLDMEHKEPILDDAEKKYLSAVIKPFRKTVMWIKKYSGTYSGVNYESIVVYVERDFVRKAPFSFGLPSFKPETMYKGMALNRKYTLEELGL